MEDLTKHEDQDLVEVLLRKALQIAPWQALGLATLFGVLICATILTPYGVSESLAIISLPAVFVWGTILFKKAKQALIEGSKNDEKKGVKEQ